MQKTNRSIVAIMLLSSLLLTFFVFKPVPITQGEPAQPLNLHSQKPLVPIHMHGPQLQPVHMHSLLGIVPINPPVPFTVWHELYPEYCQEWNHTSWIDHNQNMMLDAGDEIDMDNMNTKEKRWYHVDRVTMTMRVRVVQGPPQSDMYLEYKGPYEPYMYQPVSTLWHEVWPIYSNTYHITYWMDNGNGYLDFCDYIEFESLPGILWHVEEYATDLILNEKIMDPIGILWHELYPEFCTNHNLTSWEEPLEDLYPGRLSPGDQIDMTELVSQNVTWYYVDRVTLTLLVSNPLNPEQSMYIEYKGPFETMYNVKTQPLGSLWHEIYPIYSPVYEIVAWEDNCNGVLSYCDNLTLLDLETRAITSWHVEELSIDLILNEKIMDPTCTYWKQLHPQFGSIYHIIGWEDDGDRRLSPRDKVYLNPGPIAPYVVTDVTLTLLVSLVANPAQQMYIEFTGGFQHLYEPKTHPIGTWWIEFYPDYQLEFLIMEWFDNCNGVLSYCDNITLMDMAGFPTLWHVEELAIDITVQQPVHDVSVVSVTPLFASVFQGWPNPVTVVVSNDGDFTETFTVDCKYNGSHVTTSPIAVVNLAPKTSTSLTFCWVTKNVPPGVYTIYAYANPVPGETDLADNNMTDATVTILAPPPFYWKEGFCDYAPSGVPDFDQKQWGTYNWTDKFGAWSHCGPVAVANSLWWLDSEFEPAQPPVLPPAISDGFPLVSSYATMPPFWDDHDPQNVPWLVEHLAYLMDTDGRRTGLAHSGTNVLDMEAGLAQYLSWTGVNPKGDVNGDGIVNNTDVWIVGNASGTSPGMAKWNMAADIWPITLGWPGVADNIVDMQDAMLVSANLGKTGLFYERTVNNPDYYFIEEQVEKCEDVVLLVGYWYYTPTPPYWYREGGHYLTVAGVNSAALKIAVSDPCYDAFEFQMIAEGRVPIPHVHMPPEPPYITHNDAAYVSHDIYNVALVSQFVPQPNPNGTWMLLNYAGWRPAPPYFAVIESAVITSPLGTHDVAVTNVTSAKSVISQGYCGNITVKTENQGNFTETYNVTLYANTSIIGKQTVTLTSGSSQILTFVWNTSGFVKSNNTIKAVADTVSGESDTLDNTFVDGWVFVAIVGDVNGDKKVDMVDLWEVARHFGIDYPDPRYKPNFDIDNNGKTDMIDLWLTAREFGKIDP